MDWVRNAIRSMNFPTLIVANKHLSVSVSLLADMILAG